MLIRHPQPCFWKHDFATQNSFRLLLQFLTTSTQFFYFHVSTYRNCVYWPNSPGIAPWISSSVLLFINFLGLPEPRFLTKISMCSNHFAYQLLPGFLPRFCFSLTFRFYPNPVFDQNPKVQCHERVYSIYFLEGLIVTGICSHNTCHSNNSYFNAKCENYTTKLGV